MTSSVRKLSCGWLTGCIVAAPGRNAQARRAMWWYNDYKFEWDVDVSGQLKPGKNSVTLRLHNPHHFGGLFRRPFLYRPVGP